MKIKFRNFNSRLYFFVNNYLVEKKNRMQKKKKKFYILQFLNISYKNTKFIQKLFKYLNNINYDIIGSTIGPISIGS